MAFDWGVLIPIGFLLFMIGLFVFAYRQQRRRYGRLAAELADRGVVVEDGKGWMAGEVHGTWHGRACEIRHEQHGKNGPWTTHVTLAHTAGADFAFRVTREGVAAKIAKAFGGADHEIGDADFDARYRIEGDDVDRATFLLNADVRAAVAGAEAKRLDVRKGRVTVETEGKEKDVDRLVERLGLVERIAERLEATA